MNKTLLLVLGLLLATPLVFAADETVPAAPAAETPVIEAPATPAPAVETAPAPAPTEEAADVAVNENLEFVSGEVSSVDGTAKSLTVKLYGETEDSVTDKTLTVTTDESTDITDGEKDRELGTLAAGTEVDVEYDPATKKATYIFVY